MLFSRQEHNQLTALGDQAKKFRAKGHIDLYEEVIAKIDALQIKLITRYPHLFQLIGAQR